MRSQFGWFGFMPCRKSRFGDFARLAPNGVAFGQVGLVAQHQTEEGFAARRASQRVGVIGQRWVRCEDRRRRLEIVAVGQEMHRAGGAIGAEQVNHLLVALVEYPAAPSAALSVSAELSTSTFG